MPQNYQPLPRLPGAGDSRVETVLAAAIYLMSHYRRTGCPRLALCVARHLQYIALHPDAAPVIRDVCAALHGAWSESANAAQPHALQ